MARPRHGSDALPLHRLIPLSAICLACGHAAHIVYHTERTITTLSGQYRLHLAVRRCRYSACPRYHQPYRPEAEGVWALPHGEYGLDVIALVGVLRYQRHQSLKEIHHSLHERGLSIGERTVLNLLARYEELVTIHMTDRERLQSLVQKQGHLILAVDGLRPDVGHEVLWVVRDCVSGEILLARPLLSEREADLVTLLKEVQDALSVPIHGVISDGQHSIRNAVATAFPEIPHQLCHFHYLREAAKPVYEADRHAKKELKKQVRGIRPIEREAEQQENEEAMITRKYCLAVRSALTDDGHPPLSAPGLKLSERLSLIVASLERVAQKEALPPPLDKLHRLLTKGGAVTEQLWSDVQAGYALVHRAAHLLTNADHLSSKEVQRQYEELLEGMRQDVSLPPSLQQMTATFLKVTASYWPGLFHCYDVADLPRTNNDLEHVFGSTRYHERRATGRKQASPGLVVRGSVRVVAAVATQKYHFSGSDLAPRNLTQWRTLRKQVDYRHEARREQYRFRKDPNRYLRALEEQLSQRKMRS
jgi:hypothetical protein